MEEVVHVNRRAVTCALCSAAALSLAGRGWPQGASPVDGQEAADPYAGLADMPDDGLPDVEDDYVCLVKENFPATGLNITPYGANGQSLLQDTQPLADELEITPFGTATAALRWRPRDGLTPGGKVTLACGFLSGASDRQKQRVMNAANQWTQGNVGNLLEFRFGYDEDRGLIKQAHVRILVGYPGYLTDVGTSAKGTPNTQPTVRLYQGLEKRKVMHEFGHVLALRHEHQHPDRAGKLDPGKVMRYFTEEENWTQSQVYEAILKNWGSQERCVGQPNFAVDSVMSYDIPAKLTMDNKRIAMAQRVSGDDLKCVLGLYSLPG